MRGALAAVAKWTGHCRSCLPTATSTRSRIRSSGGILALAVDRAARRSGVATHRHVLVVASHRQVSALRYVVTSRVRPAPSRSSISDFSCTADSQPLSSSPATRTRAPGT
eukprot:2534482-Prymnesium_polylepis.1